MKMTTNDIKKALEQTIIDFERASLGNMQYRDALETVKTINKGIERLAAIINYLDDFEGLKE